MKDIKIGIILPTYNRPFSLDNALKSIIVNKYKNFVTCIIDDGSNYEQEYNAIIEKYKYDSRFFFKKIDENSGVNSARNIALEILINQYNCDYITLLDDDDTFLPDTFSTVANIINKTPHQWLVLLCQDKNGELITKTNKSGNLPYIHYFCQISMHGDATHFISSEAIKDIRFSTDVKNGEEWTFFIQISKKTDMYIENKTAIIKQYLEDGLTLSSKRLNPEILKKLDSKYLHPTGYTRKKIHRLYLRHIFFQTLQKHAYFNSIKTIFKYLLTFNCMHIFFNRNDP